ncbi:futalosine hydrolase [Actinoplanes sp. NPDC051859]|uniref:futalosine hydrolase n=1 Tax=Actinoplanes sp. NPDC051859 TaxID=3363909 RepID=UPI0037885D56
MTAQQRLLVVTAVEAEAAAFRAGADPTTVDVVPVGVGPAAAAAGTARLLALAEARGVPYRAVLSAGIAGGFVGRAEVGATVLATRSIAADLGAETPPLTDTPPIAAPASTEAPPPADLLLPAAAPASTEAPPPADPLLPAAAPASTEAPPPADPLLPAAAPTSAKAPPSPPPADALPSASVEPARTGSAEQSHGRRPQPADAGIGQPGFIPIEELGFGSSVAETDPTLLAALVAALPHAVVGDVLTLATVTGTSPTASALSSRFPAAVAEAMEGFGVACAARDAGVPFAELRTISNPIGPRDRASWRLQEAFSALTTAAAKACG